MKSTSKQKLSTVVFTILFLLLVLNVRAQIPFEDDVNDETAAPIGGLVWLLGLAGASLGIIKLKGKK
ncbi:hypothetical protein [Mesonia sp.]|uniref:hypothetical protein n=1 Tax=Mesonia sp. TaxID=1960830 RepID=UPI00176E8D81|nr:hypothetical protein [Mesonia sp.]HIB38470.1 hypothetical protein [Mesonia sp.]HIO27130.1 hypothetical protein [Flavobacteriaceae bacterium]